ncbi:MAG: flagellar hook protein FlgE [Gemmatimonadetes bacterium]|nr:flagellar hook protein FlgE [Gemmatimonadota bacterium]MCB9518997.1 flagellar hook protein FlgE [Gemmatimonadales bacterium]HPF62204.1 flagellar hook protein FlgE [Gemmatimonadales bacterium]HRX19982.1 flagellar hook protein FlgE [Gemmatimonadales bacterium]
MMRSLFAAVSGLRNHQTRLDVIGNNIANVNTVAFKASRVTFKEAFTQLLQGATRPPGDQGGVNPIQVGSGMNIGSIDQIFTQGSLESTGQNTDLAIQGDAFFVVNNGNRRFFTRAGNFQIDADGRLIAANNGFVVQGINADTAGVFSSSSQIGDVILPLGQQTAPRQTSEVTLSGNLDANAAIGDTHSLGVTVFDQTGTPYLLEVLFTNTGVGAWDWTATSPTAGVTAGNGTLTFNADGTLATFDYPGGGSALTITPTSGAAAFDVAIDAGTIDDLDGLAGFAGASNAVASRQDGYQSGLLLSIEIDAAGIITGVFSNGVSQALAQLALARFNNPTGLLRRGDNMYSESANSGLAVLGFAGTSNASSITAGALENSNVDLSQEFTSMIVTQRGFQASARVITTSDEMLNELVNLKR